MAGIPSGPPLLAERADIHKSCKAIESVLNVLDDYSQVASAMATLEKKLVKAMRELAGLKITTDIAADITHVANAFNTSASLFEALADVSTKFAKIADKECDGTGTEVRKWFKKLSAYEKKSRKNSRDAAEEHARYMNLISTLGPEISKDKFDHGTSITKQHISTTYSVAACLARIADAEWIRVCESLRRFSPTIGPLGEWRALCEGGWERPLPRELPNVHAVETEDELNARRRIVANSPKQDLNERETYTDQREMNSAQSSYAPLVDSDGNLGRSPQQTINPPSAYTRHGGSTYTSTSTSSGQGPIQSTDSSPLQPPRLLVDPNTGSVRSLSAFPPPPTHFPIPPPRSISFQSTTSGLNPSVSTPISSPQNDEAIEELSGTGTLPTQDIPSDASIVGEGVARSESPEHSPEMATSESSTKATESGVTSGGGSNSYVAVMRHRYTNSSGTVSPPPKDIPQLSTSVADLATRYQSPEPPPSPSHHKRPPLIIHRQNHNVAPVAQIDTSPYFQGTGAPEQDAVLFENDRPDQPETRELEKERQLLQLERELELKAQEIEREKEELLKARRDIAKQPPSPSGLSAFAQQLIPRPRDRKISLRRQRQQLEVPFPPSQTDTADSPLSTSQHSYYSTHSSSQLEQAPLTPSPSSSLQQGPPADMLHRSTAQSIPQSKAQQHPPYCGCERCTEKYREPPNPVPSPYALRPPEQPITLRPSKRSGTGEKSKVGWMRRLSMPVVMGHALNLDSSSSSGTGLYTLGAGIGHAPPQSRGALFSLDGKRNASATNLRVPGVSVREDGKLTGRRSYEANMATGLGARR
ncbi:hypothetical protein F5887DRAFT_879514 [Amanita rubescens]|nr:hypothetical protein F5887DRAFT_879514 [Amanita rubescens]